MKINKKHSYFFENNIQYYFEDCNSLNLELF